MAKRYRRLNSLVGQEVENIRTNGIKSEKSILNLTYFLKKRSIEEI